MDLRRILSDEDQRVLLQLINSDGWEIAKKLAHELCIQWSYSALTPDVSDDEAIKIMREYRGMRKGITQFFNDITVWQEAEKRKANLQNKTE